MESDTAVLAHDVGGYYLPVPLTLVLLGSTWVLTLTFVVLVCAWRTPRLDPAKPGRPVPDWVTPAVDAPVVRWAAALAALAFTVWVVIAAVSGPQDGENPLRGVFYVLLWVGLAVVSLVAGPVWRTISPVRTVYRLVGGVWPTGAEFAPLRYPARYGYWPAALGLFAFAWLHLASPNLGTLVATEVWLLIYVGAMVVGALFFGQRWFARADPFEVYSVTVSRLSPFRRNVDTGRIVIGHPLDHLPSMPVRPGTLAVCSVLLGAVAFDSFAAMTTIENFVYDYEASLPGVSDAVGGSVLRTAFLILFIVVVAVSFWAAARAGGGLDAQRRRKMPGQMAHTLIPIIVGYTLAHNASSLIERGQETILRLFGGDLSGATYWLSNHPGLLSALKLAFVLTGHIAAAVAIRDAGLRLLPTGHQVTGQLALMVTMVGCVFAGLYMLFGG